MIQECLITKEEIQLLFLRTKDRNISPVVINLRKRGRNGSVGVQWKFKKVDIALANLYLSPTLTRYFLSLPVLSRKRMTYRESHLLRFEDRESIRFIGVERRGSYMYKQGETKQHKLNKQSTT